MSIILRSNRVLLSPPTKVPTLFFQLPPACRSFHASPRPQFFEAAVATSQSLFDGIHSITGLPWAYTLPLGALALRITCILPVSIYARSNTQKQLALTPLISAWSHTLRKETMAEVGHLGPTVAQRTLLRKTRKKRSEIYKRWDCGLWKNYLPVLQLPIWLLNIEAVRKMCGKEEGLLGLIFGASDKFAPTAEPSLATGGALWFPDLLVPDPQLLLPFMLSGVIFLNIRNSSAAGAGTVSVFQRRLQNSLKVVALLIGPLTLHFPSAMLVYWISSSSFALGQALLLDKLMPVKPPVKPCMPRNRAPRPDNEKMEVKI